MVDRAGVRTCAACGASTSAADARCARCGFAQPPVPPAYVPDPRFGIAPPGQMGPPASPPADTPPTFGPGYPPPAIIPPGYAPPGFVPPGFAAPGFAPPGFAPPGYPPPGFPPPWAPGPPPDTRLRGPIVKTALTIAVPFVFDTIYQLWFHKLGHKSGIGNETMGRYILAGTVAFYVAAGLVLLYWLHSTGRRLLWTRGKPLTGVLWGVLVGGTLGLLGVATNSALAGHLSTDPRAVFLSSEGDVPHIVTTLLIMAVAAPLVEETLFRGILMDWLRPKGAGAAFAATAVLFAFWHFNATELRYYAVMGVILGALYWKRGLVASMTAHAAFNGTLTVVAVMISLTPAAQTSVGDLGFVKPQGWHLQRSNDNPAVREYLGPSGAVIEIASSPALGEHVSPQALLTQLQNGTYRLTGIGVRTDLAELVTEPIGEVVRIPVHARSADGELDVIATPTSIDRVFVLTAGSAKAQRDFNDLMTSLHVVS